MPLARRLAPFLILAALVAVALWRTSGGPSTNGTALVRTPDGVMSTSCRIAAVVRGGERERAEAGLQKAEAALRVAETLLSAWLADSEIARFNAAAAGETIPLSAAGTAVLAAAHAAHRNTAGAFDATVLPLVELWRHAGETGHLPTDAELADARAASTWDGITLTDAYAVKLRPGTQLDLGGIGKGWGIDRALEALRATAADLVGCLVDVGGDLRVAGLPPRGDTWHIDVQSPFGPEAIARLAVTDRAVCTSGNYARTIEVDGERFSHILDPATGRPARAAPSVTVTAPTALEADVWATALSVLGIDGLARLPAGVEALVIGGTPAAPTLTATPGLRPHITVTAPGLELQSESGPVSGSAGESR
jgi:thiamine biosynthesis lipoprotein